ncbi:flagellar M-ring protein FliF [Sphaerotilus hippei]|uniref:Flagellar M-ring protein n=1 Tax=Sphaerotilus hippei TaxID=744406 RepID=A0A318GWU5_9BURK|nr:flagellar basal-body MS-ring/collar protein FliF [Sphaerotilus hippei]PXW91934.1 flagellar M-ring protein FliF [Sphaerotilus hippei]
MDNAALQPLTANTAAAAEPQQAAGLVARLNALPMARKLMLAGGVLALVALLVGSVLMRSTSNDKVLFANLSDKDGGAIVAQLTQMNVPYKFTEGGTAILVPAEKVHDVRLKLAQAGLPKGSTVGFELMDNARFGTTQFQERLNFQRGLEGELVRSITALAAVEAARVHLALPNQNGFFRDQQKPSASVLLTLRPGRTLDQAQLAGIVHLVSASVPELNTKAVSVLDQTGSLLSGPPEGMASTSGLDAQQLQYVNHIETQYTKRIMDILEPVVGRDNLRAQVSAVVDFSQTDATSEEFRPNQGQEPAAVRSAQSSESAGGGSVQPTGVPGAVTNQPPVPVTAPINGASQPLQAAGAGGAGATTKRDAVTNYEVDKTVRVTRGATGSIKRLTAAVVVNQRSVTDKKGKTTPQSLTPEELEKITALVQETVGFNKERGDSVKVIDAPFQVDKTPVDETPLWKQPETIELVRTLAAPLAMALLALIIVFGAIRPALREARPKEVVQRVEAVVDDVQELPPVDGSTDQAALEADGGKSVPALPAPGEDTSQNRLEAIRKLARENPAAVANIMRDWLAS